MNRNAKAFVKALARSQAAAREMYSQIQAPLKIGAPVDGVFAERYLSELQEYIHQNEKLQMLINAAYGDGCSFTIAKDAVSKGPLISN